MPLQILAKVEHTILKYHLLNPEDKVLVAFSGGPDSLALLYLLRELKNKYGLSIYGAHLNHMLRGKESARDEAMVEETCGKLGIPCTITRKKISTLRKKGESLEEAARRIRYQFLKTTAQKIKAQKVALGHNKDDLVETVLMRIIRGTGEEGLAGIPETRELAPRIKIIRPLIEVERKEIQEYLRTKEIQPVEDSSNLNTDILRNKIRHQLLPYLQEYNPQVRNSLSRLAKIFRQNEKLLRGKRNSLLQEVALSIPGGLRIDLKELLSYPELLQHRVLREALKRVKGDLKDITSAHLEEIYKLIGSKKANLVHTLPGNLAVNKEYDYLSISLRQPKKSPRYHYLLDPGEKLFIPEVRETLQIDYGELAQVNYKDSKVVFMDGDKLKFPLMLRNRRAGDYFYPLGLGGRKKLKDFFIDEKVPLSKREFIPLLISGKEIIWVAGYQISDLVKITKETKRVVKVEIS